MPVGPDKNAMQLRRCTGEEWQTWIQTMLQRVPDKARYRRFYEWLDGSVPGWAELISKAEFLAWGCRLDTGDGNCMLERMYSLWDDPAYTAEQFAVLLRLFRRSTDEAQSIDPKQFPVLFDRYELIRPLGRGGCGEVYLAWSRETTTLYALKVIRQEFARHTALRQAFRREAETWIRLDDHPNVAKAYFYDEVAGALHITMAYVEGGDGVGSSLADRIRVCAVDREELARWFVQVADGLAHAYSHGVVSHRDIKPGNILIGRDTNARIADFGLAVPVQAMPSFGAGIVGTPYYMPPEQFRTSDCCDVRSDIYSLGVAMYEAASGGRLPFMPEHDGRANLEFNQFLQECRAMHERAQARKLDTPLWPVIERCLAKGPHARYQDIGAFRSAIEQVAARLCLQLPRAASGGVDLWTLRDKGNSLMRLRKYEEALEAFDAFLKLMPDESAAFNRAVCLENLGRYQEAWSFYSRLAAADDVRALVNGSNCLKHLGDRAGALRLARRSTEIKPSDVECWVTLGNAAFALKSWRDAVMAYGHAHELDRSAPTPLYNLALTGERTGDTRMVIKAFRAFLDVAMPDDERRQYAESSLRRLKSS